MRFHEPAETKARLHAGLKRVAATPLAELPAAARAIFHPESAYLAQHPVDQLHGVDAIVERHLAPMKRAMPDLERRDDIFMGGHFADHDWVCATGYYYGSFEQPWLGLPPSDNWLHVRFGEFYKLRDGRIIDAYVMLDLIDVFRQLGCNPLRPALGIETLCPGPAAQDGLVLGAQDPAATAKSLALVEGMIFDGMQGFDGVDHDSMRFPDYFTADMMWYGPGGIGTTRGIDRFMRYHEIPFNEAWPDFKGGNHKARFADGAFIASTGWPSIHGTHTGSGWLGLDATDRAFTMRVMDWWRRDGDLLAENWIFIDMLDLFNQFDRNLLGEAQAIANR